MVHRRIAATLAAAALAAPAAAEPLRVAMHYSEEQAAPLLACFDRFEATRDGVEIAYEQLTYRDYLQTVLTSRIAGQSPDVYHLYSIWGAQLVDNGVLAEPPEAFKAWVRDSFAEDTVEAATIDGALWGAPSEVSAYMMIYNKKLLAEAGIAQPPETPEALVEAAAKLTERNAQGAVERAGWAFADSVAGRVHPFLIGLYSAGVEPFADDFSGTNLASDEAVAVLERQVALFEEGGADLGVDGFDFAAGNIGMMVMANWFEGELRGAFGDAFDETVGVAPVPYGPEPATMQYAFFYGVDSGSERQDLAWELIRFVNSPESGAEDGGPSCAGEMLAGLGALTANLADLKAADADMTDAFTQPYLDALTGGRAAPEPNVLQAAEIQRVLADRIEAAWAGEITPREALEEADAEITEILSEFY